MKIYLAMLYLLVFLHWTGQRLTLKLSETWEMLTLAPDFEAELKSF